MNWQRYWLSKQFVFVALGKFLPAFLIGLFFLAACDLLGDGSAAEVALEPVTPTPDGNSTPLPIGTPDVSAPITTTEDALSLTVWLPPEIASRTDAGTAVLEQQWLAFRLARPDVTLTVEQKAVQGQGGILNYLRVGRNVAPAVLPDLIAVPTNQLAAAANEELIYPVGDWLDQNLVDDLYPAARRLGQVGEEMMAYPFALVNLPHLAYHTEFVTTTLPLTWEELVTRSQGRFVFPGAGMAGATLVLQFYLASGGSLVNEAGQPSLQIEPLTNALTQFSTAQRNDFLVVADSSLTSGDEVWQLFQGDSSLVALTTAGQYLTLRSSEFEPVFASVPGLDSPLPPLLDGWAWAITTTDPTRRALVLELMASLTANENLGEWSYASHILPAHRGAFDFWPTEDEYSLFMQAELERADAFPGRVDEDMLLIFQNALLNVISLGMTPQTAAEQAILVGQP